MSIGLKIKEEICKLALWLTKECDVLDALLSENGEEPNQCT